MKTSSKMDPRIINFCVALLSIGYYLFLFIIIMMSMMANMQGIPYLSTKVSEKLICVKRKIVSYLNVKFQNG